MGCFWDLQNARFSNGFVHRLTLQKNDLCITVIILIGEGSTGPGYCRKYDLTKVNIENIFENRFDKSQHSGILDFQKEENSFREAPQARKILLNSEGFDKSQHSTETSGPKSTFLAIFPRGNHQIINFQQPEPVDPSPSTA